MEVAVKRLKNGATRKDQENFLKEASTMAQFNDPNVVQLKGAVTKSKCKEVGERLLRRLFNWNV